MFVSHFALILLKVFTCLGPFHVDIVLCFALFSSACPDEISEDSTRSSIISDEVAPILGRRAERERERERAVTTSDTNSHSRLSDSDFSDDSDWVSINI